MSRAFFPMQVNLHGEELLKSRADLSVKRTVFGCVELLTQSGLNADRISENATPKPNSLVGLQVGSPVIN